MKINVNLSNSFVCKIKSVGYDNKTFNPFKKSWINNSEETPFKCQSNLIFILKDTVKNRKRFPSYK